MLFKLIALISATIPLMLFLRDVRRAVNPAPHAAGTPAA
jgi:hypothetical protein